MSLFCEFSKSRSAWDEKLTGVGAVSQLAMAL